jgi:hypothetical protein
MKVTNRAHVLDDAALSECHMMPFYPMGMNVHDSCLSPNAFFMVGKPLRIIQLILL